jgi:hypothetical protein
MDTVERVYDDGATNGVAALLRPVYVRYLNSGANGSNVTVEYALFGDSNLDGGGDGSEQMQSAHFVCDRGWGGSSTAAPTWAQVFWSIGFTFFLLSVPTQGVMQWVIDSRRVTYRRRSAR